MCIESVMPSSHLILCRPLLPLPPIPPSIRVFSNESALRMRWPKYWSFSFSISPSKEHPGLISFRMDWLDLLAVQGALKSLLQHHSSKASILWRSAIQQAQILFLFYLLTYLIPCPLPFFSLAAFLLPSVVAVYPHPNCNSKYAYFLYPLLAVFPIFSSTSVPVFLLVLPSSFHFFFFCSTIFNCFMSPCPFC